MAAMQSQPPRPRFIYDHPRPMVTVDVCCVRWTGQSVQQLLIRRRRDPFKGRWAFPGGFIEMNETLAQSAARELREETGLLVDAGELQPFMVAGDPGRDPRGRTISCVFLALVPWGTPLPRASDDALEARWHPLERKPRLAFDHDALWDAAVHKLSRLALRPAELAPLFPPVFPVRELHQFYRRLFGVPLAPGTFREALLATRAVEPYPGRPPARAADQPVRFARRRPAALAAPLLIPALWNAVFAPKGGS
ncbi:MAG: NUDIX domain-containing protein [Candidatus Sumerlaeia bacterium]